MENKKKKNNGILIVIIGVLLYCVCFAFTSVINARNAQSIAKGNGPIELGGISVTAFNGVVSQIQVLITVIMVLLAKKKGFIAGIIVNLMGTVSAFIQVVGPAKNINALPGIFINIITIVTIYILYHYVDKTEKATEELNESYQKAIEQAQLLKDKDESLRFLAYYDRVTSMPNRVMFMENINERINAQRTSSVVYADLDDFRHINDTFGHNLGDELLVRYAERLTKLCGDKIFAAKIGGDEFGLILPEQYSTDDVMSFIGEVARVFSEPVNIRGDVFSMTASFGVSIFPTDTRSAEDLFRSAETAMFSAKANGKNQLCFYRR